MRYTTTPFLIYYKYPHIGKFFLHERMYPSLFFAYKFLRAPATSPTLSFITKLCVSSIMISSAALGLIAAIMQGFHDATVSTLKGMSPDLTIKAPQGYLDADKVTALLRREYSHLIAAATPCTVHHTLLQHVHNTHDVSHVCITAAIDPATLDQVILFAFAPQCKRHNHHISDLTDRAIMLGSILARELNVQCGDTIIIRYLDDEQDSSQLSFLTAKARIAGIFHSGIEEWDAHGTFISLPYAHALFPAREHLVQQLYLKLHPHVSLPSTQTVLQSHLHLPVLSWADTNPALVSALALEQYAMILILMLVLLIAAITLASLMHLQLTHHRRTIAVLALYGMSHSTLIRTFMWYGMSITVIATSLGLGVATVCSYCIDHYRLITLPDIYYTAHVPAHMSWQIAGTILLLACVTSLFVSWYPARNIRNVPLIRSITDV